MADYKKSHPAPPDAAASVVLKRLDKAKVDNKAVIAFAAIADSSSPPEHAIHTHSPFGIGD